MESLIEEAKKCQEDAIKEIESASSSSRLMEIRNIYLSKKGRLSSLLSELRNVEAKDKGRVGAILNKAREAVQNAFLAREKQLKEEEMKKELEKETIDISLPGRNFTPGTINPFYLIRDEICDIFASMGFRIVEGNDIESERYNFELLNMPHDHPARDMQDTFYLTNGLLLRTQTSAAQAHTLEEDLSKGPLRIVSPGKCYRRDDDDMTHSHQFGQVEGLVVGKGVSMADLKGTLALFVKKMFGEKRKIRLRSSYFPFTEPSVEVDVSCAKCGGKGCNMCKGTGWIEILGAGEVHPNVLKMGGYDPKEVSGFAFGVGIERVAMLRYGIDDIRRFYQNDIRFLASFHQED